MKVQVILILAIILVSCNQGNGYVKKEYNDPDKVLNIEDLDTNSIYLCLSPDNYKSIIVELNSKVVFKDSNLLVDFVPAKLVYTQKKESRNLNIHVKINGIIDTVFNQNLIGVNKLMIGIIDKKDFYYKTNLEFGAWVVD